MEADGDSPRPGIPGSNMYNLKFDKKQEELVYKKMVEY